MEVIEAMLKYVISYVMQECPYELELFNKFIDTTLLERLNNIVNSDFVRLPYTEAVKLLKESGVKFDYPVEWGMDLQTEHERYLTEQVYGKPVFVTDWPRDIKAFYMRVNDDGKTVAAVDLLVPGVGELVGGSQREERLDVLLESIEKFGLNPDDYHWYVDLRRYGGTKHAGFGLGFERLIMYVTGIANIRDVESFPAPPARLNSNGNKIPTEKPPRGSFLSCERTLGSEAAQNALGVSKLTPRAFAFDHPMVAVSAGRSPSPKLTAMATLTRSIMASSRCPIFSRKRRLSMVLTCSSRMTESRVSPGISPPTDDVLPTPTSIWVGSFAFPVREVMAAAMTVGL